MAGRNLYLIDRASNSLRYPGDTQSAIVCADEKRDAWRIVRKLKPADKQPLIPEEATIRRLGIADPAVDFGLIMAIEVVPKESGRLTPPSLVTNVPEPGGALADLADAAEEPHEAVEPTA